jgi:putative peptidoglycan lipid II flippase
VDKILNKVNRRSTPAIAYLLSRLLGLLRDRLLAAHFGIGPLTDAYTAAFRLPDLLFTLLISGAVAVAFIPVLTEVWVKGDHDEAWDLASDVLNLLMFLTIIGGLIAFIFASPLVRLITPGFGPAQHQLTVNLTRIMLITPFLFAVSSVWGSIAQSFSRFFFFAISGIFYNLGIIFGIVVLSHAHSIYGVAWGVVIGAGVQALIQGLAMFGLGYKYHRHLNWRNPGLHKVVRLMIPRSIDQGLDQLNYTVQTVVGSQLATGSLTAYYYANNLKNVPLVLFGNAIATAVFPTMVKDAAEERKDKLIGNFVINARLILFLTIPAATAAVVLRGYIVRLLFGFGNVMTASTLGWFAGTIVFTSLFFLVTRVYYALQDTKTPLYTSIVAILVNIGLSFYLGHKFGVAGLAMAQSLLAAAEVLALIAILRLRKLPSIGGKQIMSGLWRMLLANTIAASAMYIMVARVFPLYKADLGFLAIGPKFLIIALVGTAAYLLPCYALQLREAKSFVGRFRKQIMRPINILNQRSN